jgi:FAD/FMN-containing dehydrogenase
MPISADTAGHAARRGALAARLPRGGGNGAAAPLALAKRTSNLFRDRAAGARQRLDLSDFDHVLEVDPTQGWVDAEGMTTYEALVAATLPHGVAPAVVPQLKTITIGGAAAGVGIESTSFRRGLVHDTLLEFDVLLPGGDIVHCAPDNDHRDLFLGFPNSYGTLGYALRLRQRTQPVRPFVELEHIQYHAARDFFTAVGRYAAQESTDFLDGAVFGPESLVLTVGRFAERAPWVSDYTGQQIFYRSLLTKPIDYLTTHDYLWRWDTDWFWCSKNVGAQNPVVRRLLGRRHLNSRTYTRMMRFNSRWGITRRLARWSGTHPESVIQDVDIALEHAPEFLAFLLYEIGILPIWICPLRGSRTNFTLYPLDPETMYVNFGFWDVVASKVAHERGHFNRLIEQKVMQLQGIKSLYSDSYFTRDEFAQAYDLAEYDKLKAKYDPNGRLPGLYEKCVLAA